MDWITHLDDLIEAVKIYDKTHDTRNLPIDEDIANCFCIAEQYISESWGN